jgi:hypothetical protein
MEVLLLGVIQFFTARLYTTHNMVVYFVSWTQVPAIYVAEPAAEWLPEGAWQTVGLLVVAFVIQSMVFAAAMSVACLVVWALRAAVSMCAASLEFHLGLRKPKAGRNPWHRRGPGSPTP